MIAGGIAGALTNAVLHPLDTVKTVRQADPKNFTGVGPTIVSIVRNRGPLALYSGIAPALVGSALSSALYFGFYEFVKSTLFQLQPTLFEKAETRVPLTALSAACGNIASSVLFVPKEVVKQRMQSGVDTGQFLAAAAGVVRTSGVPGLYRGYKATLLRNIPSTMIRFALYEEFKLLIKQFRHGDGRATLTKGEFIAAGALSGVISSTCTTPMDVLKTRFATGKIKPGTGIIHALKDIVMKDGVPGLFVGLRPRLVWSALFAAIGFTSYEMCKTWLLKTQPISFRTQILNPRLLHNRLRASGKLQRRDRNRRLLAITELRCR